MTFREEDLLPYQEIKFEKTAEYLKTVFMQWTMLQDECCGFVTDVSPDALSSMTFLNRETSDSDGFLYAPADFSSVFEQAVKDNERDDQCLAERQARLKGIVFKLLQPNNATFRQQVEKLINDELKEAKVPERMWIAANLRSKATCLADFRMKERFGRVAKPHDFNTNPTKHTFYVHLNRLVGGDGLNITVTKLIFSYETPFHLFEKNLQVETQFCYIHTDVSKPPASSDPIAATPSVSAAAASTSPTPVPAASATVASLPTACTATSAAPTTSTSATSTYSEVSTTCIKIAQPPNRAGKGYTVKDGPWRCRIGADQGTTANQQPIMVSDEQSYSVLVSMIKDYNKWYPTNEHFIVLMHSKERTFWEKSMNEKEQADLELRRKKERLAAGDDEEDDAFEETYYEWLCRTMKI